MKKFLLLLVSFIAFAWSDSGYGSTGYGSTGYGETGYESIDDMSVDSTPADPAPAVVKPAATAPGLQETCWWRSRFPGIRRSSFYRGRVL